MITLVYLHEAIVTGGACGVRVKVGFHLSDGQRQGIGHAVALTLVLHDFLEVIGQEPPVTHNVIPVPHQLRRFSRSGGRWGAGGLRGRRGHGHRGLVRQQGVKDKV